MSRLLLPTGRRDFLRAGLTVGTAALTAPGAFAEMLAATPKMTEGPFYPNKLPLDTDNDLIILNNALTPAVGDITHLTGRVLDTNGRPVPHVSVEIWQCDANAVYLHTADSDKKKGQQDKNFQGFGRFATGAKGEYYFRTIKPVPYPGRPSPHIHFKVLKNGKELLCSQIFIAGHPGNATDGIYRSAGDLFARELVSADFKPVHTSRIGEYTANFDIVLGRTPDERVLETTPPARR